MADPEHPSYTPSPNVAASPASGSDPGAAYIEGGRAVKPGRGWAWIVEGFAYFRRQAAMWILLALIFLAIVRGLQFVPGIGPFVLVFLLPALAAGMIAGCDAIDRGAELELAHLFAGFRRNLGQLILVGVIGFALMVATAIPVMAIAGTAGFYAAMTGSVAALDATHLLAFLITLALLIPINMALWFAPALVMLQGQSAPRALAESFRGGLRNIVAFLIYGAIVSVLLLVVASILAGFGSLVLTPFLGSILLGLGSLVLVPFLFGSMYSAYRDIYAPAR